MVPLTASNDSMPIVELADRVRVIPLFAALSVDELFRIAEAGEEIRHPAGRELCHAAHTRGRRAVPARGRRAND